MLSARKVLLVAFLVVWVSAPAAAETLEEIITLVEEKGRTIRDMSADFDMKMDVMGQKMEAVGDVKMLMPGKFTPARFNMNLKMKMMGMDVSMNMISDGRTLYQVMDVGGRKMVNKIDVKAVPGLNMAAVAGLGGPGVGGLNSPGGDYSQGIAEMKKVLDMKVLDDATLEDGQEAWVIEGKFKPAYYQMMEAKGKATGASVEVLKSQLGGMRLYIGKRDRFMNKMTFLSGTGTETGGMSFRNLQFNTLTDEERTPKDVSVFKYTPPEGVTPNDLTDMMRKQAGALAAGTAKEKGKTDAVVTRGAGPLLKPGINAAAFRVTTLKGREIDLMKLRGKPVVVFFWASWHDGTVKQLIELNQLKTAHGAEVQFMALSTDEADDTDKVKQLVLGHGIEMMVALGTNKIYDAYLIRDVPCWVLLDEAGRVLSSETRQKSLVELKRALEALQRDRKAKSATPEKPAETVEADE